MQPTPPAEWAPQQAMFLGFPSHPELWRDDLAPAQTEVLALARALGRSVPVLLVACGAPAAARAKAAAIPGVEVLDLPFGDIWLRDTGPVFLSAARAVRFGFNGWGGKYELAGDTGIGADMARHLGATTADFAAILEGGAIEYDGAGTILTTRQCLLNSNRNPGWSEAAAERLLQDALGASRVVWLNDGLANDHTDGHVDNLARFTTSGAVAVPAGAGADDPNGATFDDAANCLQAAGLEVVRLPSVGAYAIDDALVPASHMNWIVANGQVLVPLYGTASDARIVDAVARCFPAHHVQGLAANHILTGGGSFHCITQQVPE